MGLNLDRAKSEAKDLIELVLLPGLAALLPWKVCFYIFKILARRNFLYKNNSDQALRVAESMGRAPEGAKWLASRKLITLVDHADFYLARTRSNAWLKNHVDVDGSWPSPDAPCIFLTFHWGAGMWGLRHAAAAGLTPHALVAPMEGAHFVGRRVLWNYAQARTAIVSQTLGRAVLVVSKSLRPVLSALRCNESVLAAIDVPPDQVAASQAVSLLGVQVNMPRALLRIAVDHQIPVVIYITGLNLSNGRRYLKIKQIGVYGNLDDLAKDVFNELEELIISNPAAWHFWAEMPRFLKS